MKGDSTGISLKQSQLMFIITSETKNPDFLQHILTNLIMHCCGKNAVQCQNENMSP